MRPTSSRPGVQEAKAVLAAVDPHERLDRSVDAPLVAFWNIAGRIYKQRTVWTERLVAEFQRNVVHAVSAGQPQRRRICVGLIAAVAIVVQEVHACETLVCVG